MDKKVTALSTGFLIIAALCGASFASGQELLKFFCSYDNTAIPAFLLCFVLYMVYLAGKKPEKD